MVSVTKSTSVLRGLILEIKGPRKCGSHRCPCSRPVILHSSSPPPLETRTGIRRPRREEVRGLGVEVGACGDWVEGGRPAGLPSTPLPDRLGYSTPVGGSHLVDPDRETGHLDDSSGPDECKSLKVLPLYVGSSKGGPTNPDNVVSSSIGLVHYHLGCHWIQ